MLSHYRVDLFNAFDQVTGGGLTVFTVPAPASSALGGSEHRLTADLRPSRTWHLGPLWFVPTALREVFSGRWDVIFLSWNARQVELWPALLLARIRRVPVVLWGHGLGRTPTRTSRALRRVQVRTAAAVMTYSEAGARAVREMAPDQTVIVLLNTTGRPPPDVDDALSDTGGRVMHLGRVLAHKHVEHLVEAISRLDAYGIELTLDILGDGPARPQVEAAIERHGLGERVTWHAATTDWPTVRDAIAATDLVVLPQRAGLAVVDAFAASRPVLVADDPTINPPEADLVADGEDGFRYRPATVEALTERLRAVFSDPDVLTRASAGAGETYRRRLTIDAAAATFSQVVRAASDRPPRRRSRAGRASR